MARCAPLFGSAFALFFLAACINGNLSSTDFSNSFVYAGGAYPYSTYVNSNFYAISIGNWQTGTSLPNNLEGASAATLNGRFFLAGGYDGVSARAEVYSSSSGQSWTNVGSLPAARAWGKLIAYSNRLFYIGGWNGGTFSTVYWSSDGSTWNTCATSLPAVRRMGSAAVLGTTLYYAGGEDGSVAVNTVYKLTDSTCSSAWTTDTALPATNFHGELLALNGMLYFIGGYNYTVTSQTVYRATTGPLSWTPLGAVLPTPLSRMGGFVSSNKMYILGGLNYTGSIVFNGIYSSSDGSTWLSEGSLPASRYGGAAAAK